MSFNSMFWWLIRSGQDIPDEEDLAVSEVIILH